MFTVRTKRVTKYYVVTKAGVKVGQYDNLKVAKAQMRPGDRVFGVTQTLKTKVWKP